MILEKVILKVATNPLIVMTVAGVAANFAFNHVLPVIIGDLLISLGKSCHVMRSHAISQQK